MQDIKRNFNNGIVYLVKPQNPKKLILLSVDYRNAKERNEIVELGTHSY